MKHILGLIILVLVVPVFWVICSGGSDVTTRESEERLVVPLIFTCVLSGLLLGIAIGGLYLGRF